MARWPPLFLHLSRYGVICYMVWKLSFHVPALICPRLGSLNLHLLVLNIDKVFLDGS